MRQLFMLDINFAVTKWQPDFQLTLWNNRGALDDTMVRCFVCILIGIQRTMLSAEPPVRRDHLSRTWLLVHRGLWIYSICIDFTPPVNQ
jgi:hypothetical protein